MPFRNPATASPCIVAFMLAALAPALSAADTIKSSPAARETLKSASCLETNGSIYRCSFPVTLIPLRDEETAFFKRPGLGVSIANSGGIGTPSQIRINYYDRWDPAIRWVRRINRVDFNFSFDRHGFEANANIAGMDFNIELREGEDQLIEPRYFIGINRRW